MDLSTYIMAKKYTDEHGGGGGGGYSAGTGINITGSTISVDADSAPTKNSQKPVTSGGTKSAIDASQNASLQMLKNTAGWIGKNLIPFPYNREDGYTTNGVIFTLDSEHKVIANRTSSSTGNSMFRLTYIANPTNAEIDYYAGKILNGCPSGGSDTTYSIVLNAVVSGSTLVVCRDIGDGVTIPSDLSSYYGAEAIYIGVLINKSYSPSNLMFAPMLRLASVTDDTYEPYHEDVDTAKANTSALAPVINQDTAPRNIAQGEPFMHYGDFCTAKTTIASGATLIKDSNYTVGTIGDSMQNIITSATLGSGASSIGVTLNNDDKTVVRYGNVVNFKVGITVAETITASGGKQIVELGYVPILASPKVVVNKSASPYETLDKVFPIDSSGRIIVKSGVTLEAGSYEIIGTYICQ